MVFVFLCLTSGLPLWLRGIKNQPAMQETQVRSLGQEDPLEKGMATHSSILAWRILWTEEPGGYSPWGRKRVRHDLVTKRQQQTESDEEGKFPVNFSSRLPSGRSATLSFMTLSSPHSSKGEGKKLRNTSEVHSLEE